VAIVTPQVLLGAAPHQVFNQAVECALIEIFACHRIELKFEASAAGSRLLKTLMSEAPVLCCNFRTKDMV
jgi:hypothetical protein